MKFLIQQLQSIFIILVFAVFWAGSSAITYAQENPPTSKTPSIWMQVSPSITTLGLGFNAGIKAQIRNHYFALTTNSTELSYWNETWDISIIYGRHAQIHPFKFYIGTGVSVLGGTSYTSLFETSKHESFGPVIGFPLEGSVFWHPIPVAGLGLTTFANVNTEQPFAGIGITLRAGHFNASY